MKLLSKLLPILFLAALHRPHEAQSDFPLVCRFGQGGVNGTCVDCEPGSASVGVECRPCTPGMFVRRSRAIFCRPCPPGQFTNEIGATSCKRCPPNSAALNEGSAECRSSCRSGCTSCPPGSGLDEARNTCRRCPPGTISSAFSSTPCFTCPDGAMPNRERTECVCPPGMLSSFSSTFLTCQPCPEGSSSPDGKECVCQAGRIPDFDNTGRLAVCFCERGNIPVDGVCRPCTAAEIEAETFDCNLCKVNFGLNEEGECEECRGNSFTNRRSLQPCEVCEDGMVLNERFPFKCMCPLGSGLRNGRCVRCPRGTASQRDGVCTRCDMGSIARRAGSRTCRSCRRGWTSNEARTRCVRDRRN